MAPPHRVDYTLEEWRERCLRAERRVARYQVAHCQLLRLVADLCSAESEIDFVAMSDVRISNKPKT